MLLFDFVCGFGRFLILWCVWIWVVVCLVACVSLASLGGFCIWLFVVLCLGVCLVFVLWN